MLEPPHNANLADDAVYEAARLKVVAVVVVVVFGVALVGILISAVAIVNGLCSVSS
jgi:hypothetical protein